MCRKHLWLFCAALLGVLAGQAMAAGPEPVVYYPFDQLGGTVVDASGNGNDGTPNGGLQLVDAGYAGACYSFNGSDAYVELDRPIQDDFSLVAWINTDVEGSAGTQAYQGDGLFWSDVGGTANDFVMAVLGTKLSFFNGNPDGSVNSNGDIVTGEWVHVAGVRDTAAGTISVFIDGLLDNTVTHTNTGPLDAQDLLVVGANTLDGRYYEGLMDEVKIYDVALTEAEVVGAMRTSIGIAVEPSPVSEQTDVPRDVVLGWSPGEFVATHDVYFGTSFDDVNDASRSSTLDMLVSQGQTGTSYDPESLLEFGQTYYWRVDEVNAAPDNAVYKGDVWSFTVEPIAYPIENIVATSNGTSEPDSGPEKTVDGSGLNADGQHSTANSDMWAATTGGTEPVYIQYEFDKIYKLYKLYVWNYNVQFEALLGFGFKDVTVEYSQDGVDWTLLKEVQFAQATAKATYTANTVVDLEGVGAKYVRLTANSGYGVMGSYGLSEVRFLYTPVLAREPEPADGATDVAVDTLLDWRAGREAAAHEVYFGTDAETLPLVDTVTASEYAPGALGLDTMYYWQINEANETTGTWTGDLWNFMTQPYLVIDDFESYTDDEGNRIYESWEDGYVNDTGATVGYLDAPFAEQTVVHGGSQAMPLFYDNVGGISASEADLTLSPAQDWTQSGVTTLVVYFYGDLENDAADVYVKINGTKVTGGGSTTMALWKQWNIDLAATGANLQNVTTLTVGIEGSGSGVIYVDDVRLYATPPQVVEPADPGTDALVLRYSFENNVNDVSGNGYDGTAMNDPFYADAVADLGRAMSFDGINDYVEMPIGSLLGTLNDITVAAWLNLSESSIAWQRVMDCGTSNTEGYMFLCPRTNASGPVRFCITPAGGSDESYVDTPSDLPAGWHHVAATIDSGTMTMSVYIDGTLAVSGPTNTLPRDLGTPTQNWLGRSQYPSDGYLKALLADFRLYNRSLTAGEVNYLAGGR